MKYMGYLVIFLAFFQLTVAFAQNENNLVEDSVIVIDTEIQIDWDMSFAAKTMNIFRGLRPSNAPTFSTQAGVKYHDWILGLYGGSSTNGVYTETDLILLYYRPKFDIHLEWYYNFTEGITNIPNPSGFFDFNPETTRGLLDLIFHVRPLEYFTITSSTFLYGRDRPSLPEDDENGVQLRRGQQRYSQYFSIAYNWYFNTSKIEVHVGGAFSWNDFSGESFYGARPGFNDIGISFTKRIFDMEKVNIPVKAAICINPLTNNLYLAATVQIIQFSKLL